MADKNNNANNEKELLREDALKVVSNPIFRGLFASMQSDQKNYGRLGEEIYSNAIIGEYNDEYTADFYNRALKQILSDPRISANRYTIGQRANDILLSGIPYLKIKDAFEFLGIEDSDIHEDYKENLEDYLSDAGNEFDELKSGLLEHIVANGIRNAFESREKNIEQIIKGKYSQPKESEENSDE